jgi:hypothetical protein
MANYTFNTILLSAAKTGSPTLRNTSLSSNGVNTISLSTNDVGITFNSKTTLSNTLCAFNVQGSVFRIDTSYSGSIMAIVKTVSNNVRTYTVFPYLSTTATAVTNTLSTETDISTPDVRRLWTLGYV